MNDNYTNNKITRVIEEKIFSKETRQDKFGRDYLLLKLDNDEAVFVFPSKVKEQQWDKFQVGEKYAFIIEPGRDNSNILNSWEGSEDSIFI